MSLGQSVPESQRFFLWSARSKNESLLKFGTLLEPSGIQPTILSRHPVITWRTRGDEPAEGVFCSAFYASQISNLTQRVLVQISSKWLPCSLLMLLVGHHNFEISSCRWYSGVRNCHVDPKILFLFFWNGQKHVHFELARCDFGDYITTTTDMMKISMQWLSLKTGLWPGS